MLLTIALVMILPAVFFTASCTKKMMQTEPVAATQPEAPKASEVPQASDGSAAEAEQPGRPQQDAPQALAPAGEAAGPVFSIENIHFAFDSSVLPYQAQMILTSKADYLRVNPKLSLTIEGHCDERGTDAYNLALGERRAESVKSFLVSLGISADRLNTVSYGKTRPIAMGHGEDAWARNRRAQFVID